MAFGRSAFIYIASALDDSAEVDRLAGIIRDNGWDVCFGRSGDPGAVDADAHADVLDRAACILAVWSSNAAQTSLIRSDALEGHERGKALLACLDDAAPLAVGIKRIGLQSWCAEGDVRAVQSLLEELARLVGRRRYGRGRSLRYGPPHRLPVLTPFALTAAAASATTFVVCFGWIALDPLRGDRDWKGDAPPAALGDMPSTQATAPEDNAIGIRRRADDTVAPESRSIINVDWLERAAWQDIENDRDLPSQLEAIANYMIDFPSGVFADEARVLEAQQRGTWRRIQSALIDKGFLSTMETSSIPRTRAAAERYERSLGVTPSETLNASLLTALEAGKSDVTNVDAE